MMSVDSVQPSLGSLAVHPGHDAHDDRGQESRHEKRSRQPGKDGRHPAEPNPVLNDLGQLTGRTINTTA